jgi:hypothetical protein
LGWREFAGCIRSSIVDMVRLDLMLWKRKAPPYWDLERPALLDYAHRRGIYFAAGEDAPPLLEKLAATPIPDAEIKRLIREREREMREDRVAWAAITSAVASAISALGAWAAVFK